MLSANRAVARQQIGSVFAKGNDVSSGISILEVDGRVDKGPASDRISQCMCCRLGDDKSSLDIEFRDDKLGALCWASEKYLKFEK
jgi:hypothetical protein